jgi:hypothetical protein
MNAKVPEFTYIQKQFSDSIRNPSQVLSINGIEPRRLKIYQDLFFNNVMSFVSSTFPVLKELINHSHWDELVRDFFIVHKCETPYFLEISEEFLSYLEHSKFDFLPKFAYQLAHWEWMELYADVAETDDVAKTITNIELTDVVITNDCTWNVAYDFCVHKISAEYIPSDSETTFLIVHRDNDLSVGFIEINPLSMLLFEKIKSNSDAPLDVLLHDIAKQQNMDSLSIISGGLEIIRQWGRLGLLKRFF